MIESIAGGASSDWFAFDTPGEVHYLWLNNVGTEHTLTVQISISTISNSHQQAANKLPRCQRRLLDLIKFVSRVCLRKQRLLGDMTMNMNKIFGVVLIFSKSAR